jgi:membrane associated rhomboid family serine protease
VVQVGSIFFEGEESIAWWAHIGGLMAGAVLILFMRRRGVILFDKTRGGA